MAELTETLFVMWTRGWVQGTIYWMGFTGSDPRTRRGNFFRTKRGRPWACCDMSDSQYTQSDSAGGSTSTVWMRIGMSYEVTHHAVARRPALVAGLSTHPVQTLYTGLQLRAWVRAEISTRGHPSGREHRATTSPALCLIGRLDRAGNATFHTGRPRFHCDRSACLEYSA